MSQWDQFDNHDGDKGADDSSGGYASENSGEIYNTPDVYPVSSENAHAEETAAEKVSAEDVIVESASAQNAAERTPAPYNNPYRGQYGDGSYGGQTPPGGGPYFNQYGGNAPYGSSSAYGGNNAYGSNDPYGGGSAYGGNSEPYNNNSPYGGGAPYGGQVPPSGSQGDPYGGRYNNGPYNSGAYNNGAYNRNSYWNNAYGSGSGGNTCNSPYSPYATPPKKNKNGLIIGIVIVVIVLFLCASVALVYKLTQYVAESRDSRHIDREEYDFDYDDDGWGAHHDDGSYDDGSYDDGDYGESDFPYGGGYGEDGDPYDGYGYDDDYYGEDHSGEYYDLHDDLRWDLSYIVDFDEYAYGGEQAGGKSVYITYPVIAGDDVPNLDNLNGTIMEEVDFLKSVADDADEDLNITVDGTAYVTYMDEEKMSVVFEERVYLDYDNGGQVADYYLFSLNIDMENGVVLDNRSLINVNDDFSVDFRQRSDKQNGEIAYLTSMTDQEITSYFESDDIIAFYTPLGMEIGFNYDAGWVTVTYKDYERYLKVF